MEHVQKHSVLARRAWSGFACTVLLLATFLGANLYVQHQTIDADERRLLERQAAIVDQNLSLKLQATSNALDSIRAEIPSLLEQQADPSLPGRRLEAMRTAMIGVRSFVVIDADGNSVASNRKELIGRNFRDQERYQTIRAGGDPDQLYVSAPFVTPMGVYAMSVGKAILDAQGQFKGYVLAILDPEYFRVLLESVLYQPDMRIAVIHGDGKIAYRVPDTEQLTGKNLSEKAPSQFLQYMRSGRHSAVLAGVSALTADERLVAFRSIYPSAASADKPLVVSLSREIPAIFAAWHQEAMAEVGVFGLVVLLSGVGVHFFVRRQAAYALLQEAQQAERTAANERIHDSERRFRNLFAHLPVAYQSLDIDGRWLDANQRMAEILGFERADQLLGLDFTDFWPDEIRDQFDRSFEAFKSSSSVDGELSLVRRDGTPVTVIVAGRVQRDAEGNFLRTHCIVLDISERRAMEEKLRNFNLDLETEVQLRTAQLTSANAGLSAALTRLNLARESADIGIWTWSFSDGRLSWDARLCEWYEVPQAVVEGGILYDFWRERVHPDDRERVEAALARTRQDGTRFNECFRLVLPSGRIPHIHSVAGMEFGPGGQPRRTPRRPI